MQGSIEARLRDLPGVLAVAVTDAGVALHVHPEADARMIQAQAQAVFVAFGDPRPVMVLGGMPVASSGAGVGVGGLLRFSASPTSLAAFAAIVLAVIALLPRTDQAPSSPQASIDQAVAEVAYSAEITPDLARPVASWAARARAGAAPAVAPAAVAPPALAAEAAAPKGTKAPAPRRPAVRRTRPIAPVVGTGLTITAPACVPGRAPADKAMPKQAKGTPCD